MANIIITVIVNGMIDYYMIRRRISALPHSQVIQLPLVHSETPIEMWLFLSIVSVLIAFSTANVIKEIREGASPPAKAPLQLQLLAGATLGCLGTTQDRETFQARSFAPFVPVHGVVRDWVTGERGRFEGIESYGSDLVRAIVEGVWSWVHLHAELPRCTHGR